MVKKLKKNTSAPQEVDEEHSLGVIQNAEFIKMRTMQKEWSAPSTTQVELDLLVAHGLLKGQELSGYVLPREHVVPTPSPVQTVMFVHFVRSGLCFPPSEFLLEFCRFYGIDLHHLTLNGVLFLSAFVHLCEAFIGIPPCLVLFRYFFCLKFANNSSPPPLGCCVLQSHQGKKADFFQISIVDSLKWADKWFYLPKPFEGFSPDFASPPFSELWGKKPSDAEIRALKPLLSRIRLLQEQGLTGNGIVASFVRRRVQPLMQREHLGFEYTWAGDSSRYGSGTELSEEEVFDRLGRLLSDVPCVPLRVQEYDADHPPPEVSVYLVSFISSLFCFAYFLILSGLFFFLAGLWPGLQACT